MVPKVFEPLKFYCNLKTITSNIRLVNLLIVSYVIPGMSFQNSDYFLDSIHILTQQHSERPKLNRVFAVLSATGLTYTHVYVHRSGITVSFRYRTGKKNVPVPHCRPCHPDSHPSTQIPVARSQAFCEQCPHISSQSSPYSPGSQADIYNI